MTRRSTRIVSIASLAAMALTGCYSYAPIRPEDVSAGTVARARLDPDEARRVAEIIGRDDRLLEGEVLEADGDRLLLAVPMTTTAAGMSPRQFHQRVELRRGSILEVEARQFSALKTGLLAGAGAILIGAAIAGAFSGNDDSDGNEKPRPDDLVVPIFRFE